MTYEESKTLWKLEKDGFDKVAKTEVAEELFKLVDELINSDTILYQDFIDIIMEQMYNMSETDDIDERKQQIQDMYSTVLEHFKKIKDERSKEIR
jgi:hypothetical protein|nr:MAG TPA: hypothetical protein [Bacteriophage sp.]